MRLKRKRTKIIHVGSVAVGGCNPVSIQSMTKTDTSDIKQTVKQIHSLEKIGCEIIRVAVPDISAANALPSIIKSISIPLIADIHFDWRLAVKAIENGAHGIRINPGNINKGLKEIVASAKKHKIPIRIGVNSGSLSNKWLKKYKGVTSKALVSSALEYIKIIENFGYNNIKVSIKAPDIIRTVESYRLISQETKYPLHIGVTEAGTELSAAVRSSAALGILLSEGIGDTMRISVTGNPESEILIAKELLQGLGLRKFGPQIISCPTCGRCDVDIVKIVKKIEKSIINIKTHKKIAIMGCVVNGPGEAREADIGIACGKGVGVLFKKGKQIKTVKEKDIVQALLRELTRG